MTHIRQRVTMQHRPGLLAALTCPANGAAVATTPGVEDIPALSGRDIRETRRVSVVVPKTDTRELTQIESPACPPASVSSPAPALSAYSFTSRAGAGTPSK
ncbi:MAG: hypothetical protein ACRCYU_18680 [Nocardioides sp.]